MEKEKEMGKAISIMNDTNRIPLKPNAVNHLGDEDNRDIDS